MRLKRCVLLCHIPYIVLCILVRLGCVGLWSRLPLVRGLAALAFGLRSLVSGLWSLLALLVGRGRLGHLDPEDQIEFPRDMAKDSRKYFKVETVAMAIAIVNPSLPLHPLSSV